MKRRAECKVCGRSAVETFRIPKSKLTGHPIPDAPDDCIYYECTGCHFCFTDILDRANNTAVYDDAYWNNQDPDWYGRVMETLRLVMLANTLIGREPAKLEILDFGCGMGTFIETAREKLGMQVWGHDIILPKYGRDFFLPTLPDNRFEVIVSCEVLEHLPFPRLILEKVQRALKPGGVFAFQTAYYDPAVCKRDWWYVGPANGHVSLYGVGTFDALFRHFNGRRRLLWNNYPGIQAWQTETRPDVLHAAPRPSESKSPVRAMREAASFLAPNWMKKIYRSSKKSATPELD